MNENIKVRELNTEDFFTLIDMSDKMDTSNIIDKVMDLRKETAKKVKGKSLSNAEKEDVYQRIGFKAALLVIQSLGKAKKEFYKLLADVTNLTEDEIKKLPFTDLIQIFIKMFKQEEFKSFLSEITDKM